MLNLVAATRLSRSLLLSSSFVPAALSTLSTNSCAGVCSSCSSFSCSSCSSSSSFSSSSFSCFSSSTSTSTSTSTSATFSHTSSSERLTPSSALNRNSTRVTTSTSTGLLSGKQQRSYAALPTPPESYPRIMITGALGQIGTELGARLRHIYGRDNVLATDVRKPFGSLSSDGPFAYADVSRYRTLERLVVEHRIDWVVHLSGILSATGEKKPQLALNVNVDGVRNVIELARVHKLRVFAPSSIAVFGPETPKDMTPDETIMRPTTVYGATKVLLELLGNYYHKIHGVDFRSIRYPGIISAETMPGGGTTDYAVEVFHDVLNSKDHHYTCWLEKDTMLPMMHMNDCLDATVALLQADSSTLSQRIYNVAGVSFTPEQLFDSIRKEIPDLSIDYKIDPVRQSIANSWPRSLNDERARADWGWKASYDINDIVRAMFTRLRQKQQEAPVVKRISPLLSD